MTCIQREVTDQGIAILRIDRPEKRNALDRATLDEFCQVLADLAAADNVNCLVISTTSTKALCAGADVSVVLDNQGAIERMEGFAAAYEALAKFELPTIAVCVGDVIGGGAELACACDIRIGATNLRMAWVGARLGVPVGPARLAPLVGVAKAKELIYTAAMIDAETASQIGVVGELVDPEVAEKAAVELAEKISKNNREGLKTAKQLFEHEFDLVGRTVRENVGLIEWQKRGHVIPAGGVKSAS